MGEGRQDVYSAESSYFSVRQNNLKRLTCPPTLCTAVRAPILCASICSVHGLVLTLE